MCALEYLAAKFTIHGWTAPMAGADLTDTTMKQLGAIQTTQRYAY